MTPLELLRHAAEAAKRWKDEGLTGEPFVQLTMHRRKQPTGRTVRLFEDRGPRGEISLVRRDGNGWKIVAVFPAVAVAEWIARAARKAAEEGAREAGIPMDGEPSHEGS